MRERPQGGLSPGKRSWPKAYAGSNVSIPQKAFIAALRMGEE